MDHYIKTLESLAGDFESEKKRFLDFVNKLKENNPSSLSQHSERIDSDLINALNQIIDYNGKYYEFLPSKLKENKQIILTAIRFNSSIYNDIPPDNKCDREIALKAVNFHPHLMKEINLIFQNAYYFVSEAVDLNPKVFRYLVPVWRQYQNIAWKAIKSDIGLFRYTGSEIRDKEDFMLYVIKEGYTLFSVASDRLKCNRDFIEKAILINPFILKYADKKFLDDVIIAKSSVTIMGSSLQLFSEKIKSNREVLYLALQNDGMAFGYIPANDMKKDLELLRLAVGQNPMAMSYYLDEYTIDTPGGEKLLLDAIKRDGAALQFAPEKIKNDFNIVKKVVENFGCYLRYASEEMRDNFSIVMEAVKNDGMAIYFASDRLKMRKDIAKMAVGNNGSAINYVSSILKMNPEIIKLAVRNNGRSLILGSSLVNNSLVKLAIKTYPKIVSYSFFDKFLDKEMILEAVELDMIVLNDLPKRFYEDSEIAKKAVDFNFKNIKKVPVHLRTDFF